MAPKPEAEQKAAKKAAKKEPAAKKTTAGAGKKPVGEKGEKKKAKKAISETYKIYIYKVLKQVRCEICSVLRQPAASESLSCLGDELVEDSRRIVCRDPSSNISRS